MKAYHLIITSIIFISISLSAIANPTPGTGGKRKLTLKKGTKITLQVNDNIGSSNVEQGNVVEMMVVLDVVVNGQVVVKGGTYAEGNVKSVKRAGIFGNGAKMRVEGNNIRTIDGQRIPIKSMKLVRSGSDRKALAWGTSIALPVVGVVMGTPILIPCAVIGLLIKGRDAEIHAGTLVTAKIMEDVVIEY